MGQIGAMVPRELETLWSGIFLHNASIHLGSDLNIFNLIHYICMVSTSLPTHTRPTLITSSHTAKFSVASHCVDESRRNLKRKHNP